MITRTPATVPTSPESLDAHGGFAWWYLDLVDDSGRGLVLIWSFGLPFLPGYAHAARAGAAPRARDRPSLTLSVYEGGRQVFYDFQEHRPDTVVWDPIHHTWDFDGTRIQWSHSADGTRRTVEITLDRAIPGVDDRLTGRIYVSGRLCRDTTPEATSPPHPGHAWSPMLLACEGTATLQAGDFSFAMVGRAYHDRNAATVPLHALGIGRWWWGRVSFSDRDFVWYRLQPDAGGPARHMTLMVRSDGTLTEHPASIHLGADVPGRYGLSSPGTVSFPDSSGRPVVAALLHCVDDGPFYQRHLVRGVWNGEVGHGFAEYVVPGQVDRSLHRPFVRMRVFDTDGPNSLFLPLFTGARSGRFGRLPRWWTRTP